MKTPLKPPTNHLTSLPPHGTGWTLGRVWTTVSPEGVFKVHRLWHHATSGLKVMHTTVIPSNKQEK